MIHQNPAYNTAECVSDWRDTIAIGDIIRWPLGSDNGDKPGASDGLALVIDIETIGGWLMRVAGRIPMQGEVVTSERLRVTVLDGSPASINKIRVEILPEPKKLDEK